MANNPGGRPHLPPYSSSTTNPDLNPSIFRRSSYASVLSSNINNAPLPAGTSSHHSSQQQRHHTPHAPAYFSGTPGAFHLPPLSPSSYNPHSMYGSRSYVPSGAGSWNHPARGDAFSHPLGSAADGLAGNMSASSVEHPRGDSQRPGFFIPSYLRGSRHAARLEAYHRRQQALARDAGVYHGDHSRSYSGSISLSRHSSSVNLQKSGSSVYRGVASDIIERAPPQSHHTASFASSKDTDKPAPLPSRWCDTDKAVGLDIIGNGLELKFSGMAKANDDAAAVRADHPMPPQCGIYYYEVTVKSKNKDGLISIGFSGGNVPLNRLPGWEPDSWAYHGDDGMIFGSTSSGKPYGPKYHTADVVGCGVNFRTGQAFFTKNGTFLGYAFHNIKGKVLYPAVGMKKPNEQLGVNFGQSAFVFDIDAMVEKERSLTMQEIERANAAALAPPLTETQLIHKLVAQYLAHDGYVETARAFAAEVKAEETILATGNVAQDLEPEEDIHAIQRQKIRLSILEGDIDAALEMMNTHYRTVLHENENIYFKLRCRKFVEMIRRMSELQSPSTTTNPTKATKAKAKARATRPQEEDYDDLYNDNSMDLDVEEDTNQRNNDEPDHMETSTTLPPAIANKDNRASTEAKALMALTETLTYGQELKAEFADDPRREVKQVLEETLALIAYANPMESLLRGLLDVAGRVPIAEELNGAILVSLGKSSSAAVERLVQQTEVMLSELANDGGTGSFVTVAKYLR